MNLDLAVLSQQLSDTVMGLLSPQFMAIMVTVFLLCEVVFAFEPKTAVARWNNMLKGAIATAVGGLLGTIIAVPHEFIPSVVSGLIAGALTAKIVKKFQGGR